MSFASHQPPVPSHQSPAPGLPRLDAIVDADIAQAAGWTLTDLATAYLSGGARFLQLRAKTMSGAALLEVASAIAVLARAAGATFIVNDRADIAVLAGAHGVHVGQEDLTPAHARVVVGQEAIVGLSTHDLPQVDAALQQDISYLAVGPVFGTRTKATGYESVGLSFVREAARRASGLPVVAIGGITLETAASVIADGAASVAVISDLLSTGDPEARARAYIARLS